mmetsp:Transcript_357/g.1134  ORF Transcript_357/g.1134 Transcript_357/m.1134 type:complete len:248 (-) Transcript_357:307-1050(-)
MAGVDRDAHRARAQRDDLVRSRWSDPRVVLAPEQQQLQGGVEAGEQRVDRRARLERVARDNPVEDLRRVWIFRRRGDRLDELVVDVGRVARVHGREHLPDARGLLGELEGAKQHHPSRELRRARARFCHPRGEHARVGERARVGVGGARRRKLAGRVQQRDALDELGGDDRGGERGKAAEAVPRDRRLARRARRDDVRRKVGELRRPQLRGVLRERLVGEAKAEEVDGVHAVATLRERRDVEAPVEP